MSEQQKQHASDYIAEGLSKLPPGSVNSGEPTGERVEPDAFVEETVGWFASGMRTGVDIRGAEQAAGEPRSSVRESPDVVLVDDDAALAGMVKFGLESVGYSVVTFDSAPEALAALLALPTRGLPRLLTLAVDLPGMDGHTLHEQVQLARPDRFIVVFLSARDSDADQVRALGAGAADYLVKPVSIPVLIAKVEGWLRAGNAAA